MFPDRGSTPLAWGSSTSGPADEATAVRPRRPGRASNSITLIPPKSMGRWGQSVIRPFPPSGHGERAVSGCGVFLAACRAPFGRPLVELKANESRPTHPLELTDGVSESPSRRRDQRPSKAFKEAVPAVPLAGEKRKREPFLIWRVQERACVAQNGRRSAVGKEVAAAVSGRIQHRGKACRNDFSRLGTGNSAGTSFSVLIPTAAPIRSWAVICHAADCGGRAAAAAVSVVGQASGGPVPLCKEPGNHTRQKPIAFPSVGAECTGPATRSMVEWDDRKGNGSRFAVHASGPGHKKRGRFYF